MDLNFAKQPSNFPKGISTWFWSRSTECFYSYGQDVILIVEKEDNEDDMSVKDWIEAVYYGEKFS